MAAGLPVVAPRIDRLARLVADQREGVLYDPPTPESLASALESLLGAKFLPQEIYLISRMPSDPQQGDILPIALISLVLAFVATLYPSWRASRVKPAEALRYE